MSALTSSIKILEQQGVTASSTGSSLAHTLSQAYGDNAQQRVSEADVHVTQLYQVRACLCIEGAQSWNHLLLAEQTCDER